MAQTNEKSLPKRMKFYRIKFMGKSYHIPWYVSPPVAGLELLRKYMKRFPLSAKVK